MWALQSDTPLSTFQAPWHLCKFLNFAKPWFAYLESKGEDLSPHKHCYVPCNKCKAQHNPRGEALNKDEPAVINIVAFLKETLGMSSIHNCCNKANDFLRRSCQ